MKKTILSLTAVSLLMVGCGESAQKVGNTPACGSEAVKNKITDGTYTYRTTYLKNILSDLKERKFSQSSIERTETELKQVNKFNLTKILTESVDDRAQKSTCSAELNTIWKDKLYTWNIKYSANISSDGELIVRLEKETDKKYIKSFRVDWDRPDSWTKVQ